MTAAQAPLTLGTAFTAWRVDAPTVTIILVVAVAYGLAWRRSSVPARRAVLFGALGCGVWLVSACSFIGVYSDTLFWVRALQFVLVLMVTPFGLALGMPLTVARDALGPRGRARVDAALRSRAARVGLSPATTSAALLMTPWLIYLTGWYPALLDNGVVDVGTRILLVVVGVVYFYARLQLDPVPRRQPQGLSLLITLGESIGDGVLGVILWQGSLIAASHYAALDRTWGPSLRTDQTIGAGVFWILGDAVGLPFLMTLFARFRSDEHEHEAQIDAELDVPSVDRPVVDDHEPAPTLWWHDDPNLRDRFR